MRLNTTRGRMGLVFGFCAGLFAVLAPMASAQDARGRVSGRVADPSGAPVPRAAIEATQVSTAVKFSATSNESGAYEILYLPPGEYTVAVTAAGFETVRHKGVMLRAADRLQLDFALKVGQVSESVTVSAQVALLDSSSASLGQVTDTRRIVDLPLPAGNSQTLAQYAPGVINMAAPNHPSLGTGAVDVLSNISVNGARTFNTEFTIDGAPSMWGRNAAYSPPTEMIAEVKVQTATYDATTGRAPGGNVNMVLRGGANKLHGVAQWFHTNQRLWALSLFGRQFLYNPATGPINEAKRLQVNPFTILNRGSGTLSGPVYLPKLYNGRNRTFWAFAYEGIDRNQNNLGGQLTVPTLAQRKGDFSALLSEGAVYQIYDPATAAAAAGGRVSRQPFAGNVLPASRLDRTATGLLRFWPEPNFPGLANGQNNFQSYAYNLNQQVSVITKIDHNFSDRHRMYVRHNHGSQLFINNGISADTIANVADRWRRSQAGVFDDVFVVSPSVVNNFRAGFTRFQQDSTPQMQGFDLVGAGFAPALAAAIDPQARQLPTLNVAGYQAIGGAANNLEVTNYFTASNDVSWTRGSTMIRFGGETRVYRHHLYQFLPENPTLTFNQRWTNGPLDSAAAAPIGQGLASYLLGLPSTGSVSQNDSYADQSKNYAFYLQTDWRLSPALTLNAGIRYDYDGAITERFNRSVRQFEFAAVSPIAAQVIANYARNPLQEIPASQFRLDGGLTFAGVAGQPRGLWDPPKVNLAPRVGLAWRATPRMVVRTGYGIFFNPTGVDRKAANQNGFTAATTLNPSLDNGLTFIATLSNPFPGGLLPPLGAEGGLRTGLGQGVTAFLPATKPGYLQRWSFGIQRELPKHVFLDLAYVASRGTRLEATRQYSGIPVSSLSRSPVRDQATINYLTAQVPNPFNPLLPGTNLAGATIARQQLLRPYPHFTAVNIAEPTGYSWYHSFQFLTERRFENGFTAQFNWVWSKFMEAISYRNDADPLLERLISDLDRAHVMHFTGIYELPFGRGKPVFAGSNGIVQALVGGWQASAAWQRNSGAPLGFGNSLVVAPLAEIPLGGAKAVGRWFNTNAFNRVPGEQLAQNLVGLSTRFSGIRGPAADVWNMSGVKNFSILERFRMQFRAEFLNALNYTNLSAPNTTPTNAAFGSITSSQGGQRSIVFGLKLVY